MKPESTTSSPVSPTKAPQGQLTPSESKPDRIERLVRAVEIIALHAGAVAVMVMAANAHYKKTGAKRGQQ